jgi:hypothetical protein
MSVDAPQSPRLDAASQLHGTGTVHPCYSITARGCSPNVYRFIEPSHTQVYAELLSTEYLFFYHPQKDESMDALLNTKPYWVQTSFDWLGEDPEIREDSDIQEVPECEEGVTVGTV